MLNIFKKKIYQKWHKQNQNLHGVVRLARLVDLVERRTVSPAVAVPNSAGAREFLFDS